MPDYDIVRTEVVPGTLEHFRAYMYKRARLQPPYDERRLYLQGEKPPAGSPQAWARWEITLGGALLQRGYILARELPGEQTEICFANINHPNIQPIGPDFAQRYADEIIREMNRPSDAAPQPRSGSEPATAGGSAAGKRPALPPKPDPQNAPLDDWFDWYYQCKQLGFRITLREIANRSGYSYSHIRNQHSLYKAEHQPDSVHK